jgi:hypothetical protein
LVQAWRSGQTLQATPNRARPPPRRTGTIATVTRAGQVTVPAARSMRNLVFGELPARCGRELRLHHRREPLLLQPG